MYNYYVKETQEFGRGLYALTDIPEQRILFSVELLVLSEKDTKTVNETDLQYYTFVYNEKQDCLVLGDGELFNHSDDANVGYKLTQTPGTNRKMMTFYTIKPIKEHEQLFINYNQDVAVNTASYNKNLL